MTFPELSEIQTQIINGSLLGDGELSKTYSTNHNSHFCKTQCKKFKEYLIWHKDSLSPYVNKLSKKYSRRKAVRKNKKTIHIKTNKRLVGYTIRTKSCVIFSKMRETWYPLGKKIVPKNLKLTPLTIAIWFCDDGSNDFYNRRASISTNSFTYEEVLNLKEKFVEFNIVPKIRQEKPNQYRMFFTGISYDNLIALIKDFIVWECFKYKINHRKALLGKEQKCGQRQKLDQIKILHAKQLKKEGVSWAEISRHFNVSTTSIRNACKGVTFKYLCNIL